MQTPARRLLLFIGSLAALALALEGFVRAHEAPFAAATNRALAKAALLDAHGPEEVLFFGTSRVQDGVSPQVFSEALGAIPAVPAFNLAFTSSSLASLEELAKRYEDRPGLRLAFIELSTPQLENGGPVWDEPVPGPDVEGQLTEWIHAHVRTIAHRQALVSDNVVRLPSLIWFAPALDGSETRLTDQFAAFFGQREGLLEGFEAAEWQPVRWTGSEPLPANPAAPPRRTLFSFATQQARSQFVERLTRLVEGYRSRGVRIVFVVPPLTVGFKPAEERGDFMKSFFILLAKGSGAEVWDYSGLVLPDRLFRGESHLNRIGRAYFSEALAREVASQGLLERNGSR